MPRRDEGHSPDPPPPTDPAAGRPLTSLPARTARHRPVPPRPPEPLPAPPLEAVRAEPAPIEVAALPLPETDGGASTALEVETPAEAPAPGANGHAATALPESDEYPDAAAPMDSLVPAA